MRRHPAGEPIGIAYGSQFARRGVCPDDLLYIVSVNQARVHLLGKMHTCFIQSFFGALLAMAFPSCRAEVCPWCGGALTKVGDITDDQSKPSKNLGVWNRSICANPFYDQDSVICSQCWHAYSKLLDSWERSSELPDSFRRPLAEDIRLFPLPSRKDITSLVVYSQNCTPTQVTESVGFWCIDSPGGGHFLFSRVRPTA